MNVPPEENPQAAAPAVPEAAQAAAPVEQAPEAAQVPQEGAEVAPAQTEQRDAQVISEVAQGLEDEEITAEDIMTAVLSETLGLSPRGAQSLFKLLMQDLVDEEATVDETAMTDVPPQEGV